MKKGIFYKGNVGLKKREGEKRCGYVSSRVGVGSASDVSASATLTSHNSAKKKPFETILVSLDRAFQALLNSV
jgi:hypothetical protein